GPDWIAFPNCARKLGPRFGSYRTSAAADDINDVRRALGYRKITLYGDSTGVRSMSISCRRSPKCSGSPTKRLAKLVHFLRDNNRGVGPLVDALGGAG